MPQVVAFGSTGEFSASAGVYPLAGIRAIGVPMVTEQTSTPTQSGQSAQSAAWNRALRSMRLLVNQPAA